MYVRRLPQTPGRPLSPDGPAGRFHSVILPHLDDAFAFARWLTGSPADAEDVVQDAFIRAYRGMDQVAKRNARAWVLTNVRHAAREWLSTNPTAALGVVEDPEAIARDVGLPGTVVLTHDAATPLEAAIAALPLQMREILVLHDVQGLCYREIAAVTGVPVSTIMSRLARARQCLMASSAIPACLG